MKRISSLMSRKSSSNTSFEDNLVEKEAPNNKSNITTIPILILGPRGSGKTSFLYKSYFKYGTDQPNTQFNVIPTPTYNVEIIPYEANQYELWDFAEISSSLNYISENTRVIIYMIDCVESCKETVLSKGKENMAWLLENFGKLLENTIIITVANKQDNENGHLDIQDIGNSWVNDKNLMSLLKGHYWRIFPCNSLNGDGIDVIFDYVTSKLLLLQRQKTSTSSSSSSSSTNSNSNKRASFITTTSNSLHDPQQQQESTISNNTTDIITPWDNLPNPYHLTDKEFKLWFYQGKSFLFFDHWCLIRIIYLSIMNEKKRLLHNQLENILSLQQIDNKKKSIQYSETQTLFWVQMVSFALLKYPLLEGENNDFESFLSRCQLKDDCWKDYYTFKLFYSPKASKEFLPPDKKSLPNAFKSSSFALRGSRLKIDYQVL